VQRSQRRVRIDQAAERHGWVLTRLVVVCLQKNALKFMQEMAMYIFWVLCFTGTIYMTREGTQSYQFANLFQSWLIDNDGWLDR